MKYLLDTHILLWAMLDTKRLSKKARTILENPVNTLYFSPMSLWEISIKHAKHPEQMAITSEKAKELILKILNRFVCLADSELLSGMMGSSREK